MGGNNCKCEHEIPHEELVISFQDQITTNDKLSKSKNIEDIPKVYKKVK